MKSIRPDPGYQITSVDAVRSHFLKHVAADEQIAWPVHNRRTNAVDCVIGPCSLDDMLETLKVIDGPVVGQWRSRWEP